MKWLSILFWSFCGIGLGLVYLSSQRWSVKRINPEKPRLSKLWIIGGAFIRWIVISILLIIAMKQSITSAILLFGAFMITRLIILLKWEGMICPKLNRIKSID